MAVSVTGPRAVNELGGPVTPGISWSGGQEIQLVILSSSPPPMCTPSARQEGIPLTRHHTAQVSYLSSSKNSLPSRC